MKYCEVSRLLWIKWKQESWHNPEDNESRLLSQPVKADSFWLFLLIKIKEKIICQVNSYLPGAIALIKTPQPEEQLQSQLPNKV